ncbi:MAG: ABC transporter substrate-binding protein [Candidatus Omnitrophica bacterium]|nr:ABC transporter substrate-binding protein [Candidatus Omnitrophota bacterium]
MRIRIGHSPDPDDAFLFYGLTHGKVGLDGLEVSHLLEGIEQLNERALAGELEMTAISLAAYPYCASRYLLLATGASVGDGYGPVLVSKEGKRLEDLRGLPVAIPGRMTTAALLLKLAMGPSDLVVVPFDRIVEEVQAGRVGGGVLIHEGQITYASFGLTKLLDLGEWWKEKTGLPVPLGVNAIRRDLGSDLIQKLAAALKMSLEYAFSHREEALKYAQQYGRSLDLALTDRFVGMYVNRYSRHPGQEGALAMQRLLDWAAQEKFIPGRVPVEFAEHVH